MSEVEMKGLRADIELLGHRLDTRINGRDEKTIKAWSVGALVRDMTRGEKYGRFNVDEDCKLFVAWCRREMPLDWQLRHLELAP